MEEGKHTPRHSATGSLSWHQRIDRLLRSLLFRWRDRLDSELAEDCRQEAAIMLLRLEARLKALPEGERDRYAWTCLKHYLRRFLQRERQQQARTIAFEELSEREKQQAEMGGESVTVETQFFAANWQESISSPALTEALKHLPARDHIILDLSYIQGLTDAEIAAWTGRSAPAVKMQRHRLLAKLRLSLDDDLYPSPYSEQTQTFSDNLSPACYLS